MCRSAARSRSCWPRRYQCLGTLTALARRDGIHLLDYSELNEKQQAFADEYFRETIFPVLTPLAFDPGRPFPHISNLSLNLAVLIRGQRGPGALRAHQGPGLAAAVGALDRLAQANAKRRLRRGSAFVWIEQVIAANLQALFPGMKVVEAHPFHVTRDADIAIKELEAEDLLETIEEGVRQRRFGSVVRLKVTATCRQTCWRS